MKVTADISDNAEHVVRFLKAYESLPMHKREALVTLAEKLAEANDIVTSLFNDKKGSKEKIA